ncbi:MAG: DUF4041 domain-containing protein [Flavobacteriaceae bacterium]|nr:DUF4041 domain-containing protein [Flavobacteriaceae bacterium]
MEIFLIIVFFIPLILCFVLRSKLKKAYKLNEKCVNAKLEIEQELNDCQLRISELHVKYDSIISIENEVEKSKLDFENLQNMLSSLKEDYHNKHTVYEELKRRLAIYEEQMELAELGIYTPHFDFNTSELFKHKIGQIKEQQKQMIRDGLAVTVAQTWTVNGSEKEGARMTKQAVSLALRSFNNECDVLIANTTWKNISRMEQRIEKSFSDINKFNQSNTISISSQYKNLKLNELRLVYERKLKLEEEREHQAELRRREREEEQLRKEVERAKKEELKLLELLEKIQERAKHTSGVELDKLHQDIQRMGDELKEMQRKNDRVKAMAEQTKLGYVYVISNIGSFGRNVYKIGMTRRLDPMERVRELGDASVPFYFDVHAMIFSEDAPALEAKIQRAFADKRVNLINHRKEFFNVELDEIKKVILEEGLIVDFVDEVEAKEYTESRQIRDAKFQIVTDDDLPSSL